MIRSRTALTLCILALASTVAAQEAPVTETMAQAIDVATQRSARLRDVIAPNGIKMSLMQPDGTVDVVMRDDTARQVRLDLVGGYLDGECRWALQLPSRGQFDWIESLRLQGRLHEEGWPAAMTDTTDSLSAAECAARSSLIVLNDGCRAILPVTEDGDAFHFAIDLPEMCS